MTWPARSSATSTSTTALEEQRLARRVGHQGARGGDGSVHAVRRGVRPPRSVQRAVVDAAPHPAVLRPTPPRSVRGLALHRTRLERNKRPELLIDAMAETKSDVALHIAGTGSLHDELQAHRTPRPDRSSAAARLDERGRARATPPRRAVLYAPYDEDYGYITLQAFAAGKPVVTTSDAGAVLEWVTDDENGLVAEPTARSLEQRSIASPRTTC